MSVASETDRIARSYSYGLDIIMHDTRTKKNGGAQI